MMIVAMVVVMAAAAVTAAWLGDARSRGVAVGALVATAALSAIVGPSSGGIGWAWIPELGVSFRLDQDGPTLLLVLMSCLVGLVAIVAGLGEEREDEGAYQATLLTANLGAMGCFLARDPMAFFAFFELMLIPGWLLIARWGDGDRARAASKFFLFTQAGGLALLVGLIGVAVVPPMAKPFFVALLLIGLGVKLPVVPLHAWLADAYAAAPIGATVLFAGVLSKAGGYGLWTFGRAIGVVPGLQLALAVAGAVGVLVGAALAFGQTDLKRLVAYSSMSHLGYVALAVAAANPTARVGALVLMIAHGLTVAGMFLVTSWVAARAGTRDLRQMGGLWAEAPRLAFVFLAFAFASLGLPGFAGFAGETIALLGVWAYQPALAAVAQLGVVGATLYATWATHAALMGAPAAARQGVADLSGRELGVAGALLALIVGIGLWPGAVVGLVEAPAPSAPASVGGAP
jgi:NADH-quinone oxidoreductase subunit M